ncbi:MAG: helix-turn-helix domain-containing protein, partial [Anaerolineales bacterium]
MSSEEQQRLDRLRRSRVAPQREVQRADILLRYHSGQTIAEIARAVGMTRKSIGKWIQKALTMGAEAALKDTYHRPREPVITDADKAWVVNL